MTVLVPGQSSDMQPSDDNQQPKRQASGLATLEQVKAWHREGTNHFRQYAPLGRECEAAVYGEQWTAPEIAKLRKAGRVELVFNELQKNVLAVDGYRAENKQEIQYLPKEGADADEAKMFTVLAKHFWDACEAEFEMDMAKMQQYVGPMAWLYCGFEREDMSREPLKLEYVHWTEMRYDPYGKGRNGLKWRYESREQYYDLEDAKARWPEVADKLEAYATHSRRDLGEESDSVDYGGDPYSDINMQPITYLTDRAEVLVVETWYRLPRAGHYIQTPTGWERFRPNNVDHQVGRLTGANIQPGVINQVYYAVWCGGFIIEEGESDYDHPYFPYVPMWGLVDHNRCPVGAVAALLDPQKSHNMAMSKKLWLAQSNVWMVPNGSVRDLKTFRTIANRPDAIIEYDPEVANGAKPERLPHEEQGVDASDLADRSLEALKSIGGSPDAFRGQQSNETTGVAIAQRKEGALRQQGLWFREEKRTMNQIGIMWRSMIAQKVTNERIVRITQPNGAPGFAAINVTDPLRRDELASQGYQVAGSITRLNYDTAVVAAPMSATVRERDQAEQDMVNDMLSPDQLAAVADIRLANTDIKDKDLMVKRIAELRQPPPGPAQPSPHIVESMNYKDAPPDIQRQMEAAGGFQPSAMGNVPHQQAAGSPQPQHPPGPMQPPHPAPAPAPPAGVPIGGPAVPGLRPHPMPMLPPGGPPHA